MMYCYEHKSSSSEPARDINIMPSFSGLHASYLPARIYVEERGGEKILISCKLGCFMLKCNLLWWGTLTNPIGP